jgi:uncharacterized protein (DUF3084 family)
VDDLLKNLEDRVERTLSRLRELEADRASARTDAESLRASVSELRTAAATLVGSLDEAIRELRRDGEDRARRKKHAAEQRGQA